MTRSVGPIVSTGSPRSSSQDRAVNENQTDTAETSTESTAVPPCTGWRCDGEGTIATGDFGLVCQRCYQRVIDTVGT